MTPATTTTTTTRSRLSLQTQDGHSLTAYRYEPARPARAELVIAPAMAVPQSFYTDFATWLAGQGYRVWSFDYRGMGESRHGSRRACRADVSDWVTRDLEALVRHAGTASDGLPLFVLGHSLGGQTLPLLPSVARVNGAINVAVGSGAMRHNQPKIRRSAPLLWYVLTPLLCPLFGYFPGSRIGVIGDVPRNAMYQWRRWCLSPDYLLSGHAGAREAYARVRHPLLVLTFSDDELLLESGSKMLHDAYSGTQVDYRVVTPQQFGLSRIGHFGFFKKNQERLLWPVVSGWLDERCSAAAAKAAATA